MYGDSGYGFGQFGHWYLSDEEIEDLTSEECLILAREYNLYYMEKEANQLLTRVANQLS